MTKQDYLNPQNQIEHFDIKNLNQIVDIIEMYGNMSYTARDLYKAAKLYEKMLQENVKVILTLAGSLINAGLKKVIVDLIKNNMVHAIVSTGANLLDQDFHEALGFKHYKTDFRIEKDEEFKNLFISRIYDTLIDEMELRITDIKVGEIADLMHPGSYSSMEFMKNVAKYIEKNSSSELADESIIYNAYKNNVPIFIPAFADSAGGFGLVKHQMERKKLGQQYVSIDGIKDFYQFTEWKIKNPTTGLVMLGGGVPKNFAQDVVVCVDEIFGKPTELHKYAIQMTVANEYDGALSGSTLSEAMSWGKVNATDNKAIMVHSELVPLFPLIAGYVYHKFVNKS